MMTVPPTHLVFQEPKFDRPHQWPKRVQKQLKDFGYTGGVNKNEALRWLEDQSFKWGIKENSRDRINFALDHFDPVHILLLIRDVRDIASSYWHRASRLQKTTTPEMGFRTQMIVRTSRMVQRLSHRRVGVTVSYEALVSDPGKVCGHLSEDLDGWPFDGSLVKGFTVEGWRDPSKSRAEELERHGGKVSSGTVGRWKKDKNPAAIEYVKLIEGQCSSYQDQFGYA
jgi:hypothetical protein